MNYYLELITYGSKNVFENLKKEQKKFNNIRKKMLQKFQRKIPKQGFTNNVLVFNSKMVPILLEFYTRESNYKKK